MANRWAPYGRDAAEALAQLAEDSGATLIELAIGFVLNHRAVTSAINGPRTTEHLRSQLTAADVLLDTAVLDRIDDIVALGVVLNRTDSGYTDPALDAARRRQG